MSDNVYHVLFVDDDNDFLHSLQMLASTVLRGDNNGVELVPHFVNNPNDGLDFVQALTDECEKIALIVCDQQMPAKILLTGYASLASAKYAINNKILDHYVSKPIEDYESFTALIANAIRTFHYRAEKEISEQEIKRYVKELEETNERVRKLQRAAEKIAYLAQGFRKLDWNDVLDFIVSKIPDIFNAKYSSLFLLDDEKKNLKMVRLI